MLWLSVILEAYIYPRQCILWLLQGSCSSREQTWNFLKCRNEVLETNMFKNRFCRHTHAATTHVPYVASHLETWLWVPDFLLIFCLWGCGLIMLWYFSTCALFPTFTFTWMDRRGSSGGHWYLTSHFMSGLLRHVGCFASSWTTSWWISKSPSSNDLQSSLTWIFKFINLMK